MAAARVLEDKHQNNSSDLVDLVNPASAANNDSHYVSSTPSSSGMVVIGDAHQIMPVGLENIIKGLVPSNQVLFMGDTPGDSTSEYSKMLAMREWTLSRTLEKEGQEGTLHKAIQNGEFSQEQLSRVTGIQKKQQEMVQKHAASVYSAFQSLLPNAHTIAGNHDTKNLKDEWKNFHFQKHVEIAGVKGYALGAGGAEPVAQTGTSGIFWGDTGKLGNYHIDSAQKDLVQSPDLVNVWDHTGPFLNYSFQDGSSVRFNRFMDRRFELGLEMPTVWIGHHHKDRASFDWKEVESSDTAEKYKIPVFHPGVMGREANSGSQTAFTHVDKFDEKGRILAFEDYHLRPILDANWNKKIQVVKHARHTVDWKSQETNKTYLGQEVAVLDERVLAHEDESIDAGYVKDRDAWFNADFSSYDVLNPEDVITAEKQFTDYVLAFQQEMKYLSEEVKFALDAVKNKWQLQLGETKTINSSQQSAIHDDAIDALYATALRDLGEKDISTSVQVADRAFKLRLINTQFGISANDLLSATNVKDLDWSSVPFNWASSLYNLRRQGNKISQHVQRKRASGLLGIDATVGNAILDRWSSQAVERKKDTQGNDRLLDSSTVVNLLYSRVAAQGQNGSVLFTADELIELDSDVFAKKDDFKVAKTHTAVEVDTMFNIDRSIEENLPYQQRKDMPSEIKEKVLGGIREGKLSVYEDSQGQYTVGMMPTSKGYAPVAFALDENIQQSLAGDYTVQSLEQAIDSGEAQIVRTGSNHALSFTAAPGSYLAVDWEKEGIDPTEKSPISLYELSQSAKQKNGKHDLAQAKQLLDLERLKQELLKGNNPEYVADTKLGYDSSVDDSVNLPINMGPNNSLGM